jgi:hypothetical protein
VADNQTLSSAKQATKTLKKPSFRGQSSNTLLDQEPIIASISRKGNSQREVSLRADDEGDHQYTDFNFDDSSTIGGGGGRSSGSDLKGINSSITRKNSSTLKNDKVAAKTTKSIPIPIYNKSMESLKMKREKEELEAKKEQKNRLKINKTSYSSAARSQGGRGTAL